jgi:dihydropteroate synthase-like protein
LSLTEKTIDLAKETDAIPILVPAEPGSLESLERAMETMERWGKPYIADPILDPIHFGLTASIVRYYQLREKYPDIPIMMGVGNLTELTDADTSGINAMLFGIISELNVSCVLATEVSPHARRAIREADVARRMMYAAKQDNSLPRDFTADLLVAHERKPFTDSRDEIVALAENIKDPNYRIKIAADGIYLFNRDGIVQDIDPFEFYPHLNVENDPGHAFYLGVELARAEVAWQLGKRYTQDEDLQWGCAVDQAEEDLTEQKVEGTTMKKTKKERICGTPDAVVTPRENMKKVVRDEQAPKVKKPRTACGTAEPKKKKKGAP